MNSMVTFEAIIERTQQEGEKYGWTYVIIPVPVAQQMNPGVKIVYRVKGRIGGHECRQVALLPYGEGSYILPLNAAMRKDIVQGVGETLLLSLEVDPEEPAMSAELLEALSYDTASESFFLSLSKSHQRYYSNWIDSAKTFETKSKRLAMSIEGCARGMDFGKMMRHFKKNPL